MTIKHFNLTMLSLVGLLLMAYIVLTMSLVFNAVLTGQTTERQNRLATQVTALESEYLQLSGEVTIERAYALGFRDAPESTYALVAQSKVY